MSAFNMNVGPGGASAAGNSMQSEGNNEASLGSSAFMNRLKQYSSSTGLVSSNFARPLPGQVKRSVVEPPSSSTAAASTNNTQHFHPYPSIMNSNSKSESNNTVRSKLPGSVRSSQSSSGADVSITNSSYATAKIATTAATISATTEQSSSTPEVAAAKNTMEHYFTNGVSNYRISQFNKVLEVENVDLSHLRSLAWNGVPQQFRPDVWQILLGYLPTNRERRQAAITRKRKEYFDSIPMYLSNAEEADRTTQDGENLRQIQVDLPRTSPDIAFFQQPLVQRAMERILYLWAIRHPASGYVQGMNDLLTPLLLVSLQRYVENPLRCDVAALDSSLLSNVEADAYWCLTKLLDNIQDHYTFSQPGLQRMMLRLEDLINRIDSDLNTALQNENVAFPVFSFRWMNCFLLRELPLRSIIRLWDTYFAEEDGGFENFHVYVCAVLLKTFRDQLMSADGFHEIVMFLQNPPTSDWEEAEVEPILSQAFILSTLFDSSPSHLS